MVPLELAPMSDTVTLSPAHLIMGVITVIHGDGFTVIGSVVASQLVEEEVNVNIVRPSDTPVTSPSVVTVATEGMALVQVPPLFGNNCLVSPMQMLFGPFKETVGNGLTVIVPLMFILPQPPMSHTV